MTKVPATPTATVLVVEHSAAIRRLFEVVLRDVAGRLVITDGPDPARDALRTETFDVVVLEPHGADGLDWDLLDELVTDDIPTIIVTSRADDAVFAEAGRRGAAVVITKPFQPVELQTLIAGFATDS